MNKNEIFDVNYIDTPYWNDVLHDERRTEKYNINVKIIEMSPDEYLEEVGRRFGNDGDRQKEQLRRHDSYIIDELKELVVSGKKLPLTFIDYTEDANQDGRHRMMAVGELFGFDKKYPVAIFTIVDRDKWMAERESERRARVINKLQRALSRTLKYKFTDIADFLEQLQYDIDRVFGNLGDEDDSIVSLINADENKLTIEVEDTPYEIDKDEITFESDESIALDDLSVDEIEELINKEDKF